MDIWVFSRFWLLHVPNIFLSILGNRIPGSKVVYQFTFPFGSYKRSFGSTF